MERDRSTPRRASSSHNTHGSRKNTHVSNMMNGAYEPPSTSGGLRRPSNKSTSLNGGITEFLGEDGTIDSFFRTKESRPIKAKKNRFTEHVSDFETAIWVNPENEALLLPLEGDESSLIVEMDQEVPIEPDDDLILNYFTSFDYIDSIPDLRPLWRDLGISQNEKVINEWALWKPYRVLRDELRTHCTSEKNPEDYRLLKSFYANEETVELLKFSQKKVGELLKKAPVLSYVLLKQYQSFRYYIVGTKYHVLLQIASTQTDDSVARIDIENEAIILHVHATEAAYKWLYRTHKPSFSALTSDVAKYGSVDTFNIFLAHLEKVEDFELLCFTRKAAKFDNSELCIHMIDLFKKGVPSLNKSNFNMEENLSNFKEINPHGGGLRVISPPLKRLLGGVIYAAAIKGAADVITGLQNYLTPEMLCSVLDTASQNNKTKVFQTAMELLDSQVNERRMTRFIQMALVHQNREILSFLLLKEDVHFLEKLFSILSMKAEVPEYPIPELSVSWGALPLAELTDHFAANRLTAAAYKEIEPLWPCLAEALSSPSRSRETIQAALACFPKDAPPPGICGLVSRGKNRYSRVAFWVFAAFLVIGGSVMGFLISYKAYGLYYGI